MPEVKTKQSPMPWMNLVSFGRCPCGRVDCPSSTGSYMVAFYTVEGLVADVAGNIYRRQVPITVGLN